MKPLVSCMLQKKMVSETKNLPVTNMIINRYSNNKINFINHPSPKSKYDFRIFVSILAFGTKRTTSLYFLHPDCTINTKTVLAGRPSSVRPI